MTCGAPRPPALRWERPPGVQAVVFVEGSASVQFVECALIGQPSGAWRRRARCVARETRADGSRARSPPARALLDDADMWTRSLDRDGYAPRPSRAPPPRAPLRHSHPPAPPPPGASVQWRCCRCRRSSASVSSSSASSRETTRCVAPSARCVARKTRADGSRARGRPRGARPFDDADMWTRSLDRPMYAPRPEPRAAAARASPSLTHPTAALPPAPGASVQNGGAVVVGSLSISQVLRVQAQQKPSGAWRCPRAASPAKLELMGRARGRRAARDRSMTPTCGRGLSTGRGTLRARAAPPRARPPSLTHPAAPPPCASVQMWRCCQCRRLCIGPVLRVQAQQKPSGARRRPRAASPAKLS